MPLDPRAQQIVPYIKYEWEMFLHLEDQIKKKWVKSDQFVRNVLLEDLLLHARLLRDFFIGKPRERFPKDVLAWHFFDDPTLWEQKQSALCKYLRCNRERINQKLAHLSYDRLTLPDEWQHTVIFSDLHNAWQTFLDALPDERRAWFQ